MKAQDTMANQRKTFSILGLGVAVIAAGLIGAAQPASAAGMAHPTQIGQTVVRDNNSDHWRRIRHEQEVRRQEEFRREQWRHDHRQEFRDGGHDQHNDNRDRHFDNHDQYNSNHGSYRDQNQHQDNQDRHNDNH